jgi:DNA-directed RNA polymerase subunit RPC12/RpoP
VREAIAKAFPVAVDLFRLAREEPYEVLGDAWQAMLEVRAVYEKEVQACRASFEKVSWPSTTLADAPFNCPKCHSDLVAQADADNTDHTHAEAECRSCGSKIAANTAIEHALQSHLSSERYVAYEDGGFDPLERCPECGLETYLLYEHDEGCAWCEFVLDAECARCFTELTPSNISFDSPTLCSYCDYVISKDDEGLKRRLPIIGGNREQTVALDRHNHSRPRRVDRGDIVKSRSPPIAMPSGGENTRPELEPSRRSVGIRLTRRNRAINRIQRLRASIYQLETPAIVGKRKATSARTNCFGARHYQPHIKLLRPGSGIERDLIKLGEIFRSEMEWIEFDRFEVRSGPTAGAGAGTERTERCGK